MIFTVTIIITIIIATTNIIISILIIIIIIGSARVTLDTPETPPPEPQETSIILQNLQTPPTTCRHLVWFPD